MARPLRQSTSYSFRAGPFVDDTDGFTAEEALTIIRQDVQLSKDGAAFAQTSQTGLFPHDTRGWYKIDLTAADTDTLGPLTLQVFKTGALPVWEHFSVIPTGVYDSLIDGTNTLPVNTLFINNVIASGQVNTQALYALNQYDPPTNTEMVTAFTEIKGVGWSSTDTLEAIRDAIPTVSGVQFGLATSEMLTAVSGDVRNLRIDWIDGGRLDVLLDASVVNTQGGGSGLIRLPWHSAWDTEVQSEVQDAIEANYLNKLVSANGTIDNALADATSTVFKTNLTAVDDTYNDQLIRITSGALDGQCKPILDYDQTNGLITLEEGLTDAPSNGVTFVIFAAHEHPVSQIQQGLATTANVSAVLSAVNSLNNLASGQINTQVLYALNEYGSVKLSQLTSAFTEIKGAGWDTTDTLEAIRNCVPTISGIVYTLASSEMLTAVSGDVRTLAADWANGGRLDNLLDLSITNTQGGGSGLVRIPWNPSWDIEVESEVVDGLTSYSAATTGGIASILSSIAGLNNLSSGQVNVQVMYALNEYDVPTKVELDSAVAPLALSSMLTAVSGDVRNIRLDWQDGGRLDLILDELTVQGDTNETKLNVIISATQYGGSGLVNIPWNANWSPHVSGVLLNYGVPTLTQVTSGFTEIKGVGWDSSTDTLKAIQDVIPTISGITAGIAAGEDYTDILTAISGDARILASEWANGGRLDNLLDNSIVNTQGGGSGLIRLPWNPAWDTEVESEVVDGLNSYTAATTANVASVLSAVSNLNNLSSGQVNTQALYALNQYDPPTRSELTTDISSVLTAVNAIWTSALAESYRSTGSSGTASQLLYEILGNLINASNAGGVRTVTKLDKSTTAKTYTYDSPTSPTSIEETT